jgi:hypothetical protein
MVGSGKRLFPTSEHVRRLQLVDSTPTTTGGVMLTHRPER